MKRIYEKDQLLLSIIFLFLLLEVVLSYFFFLQDFRRYQTFSGIVVSEKYFKSYLTTKQLNEVRSVKSLYIKDHRYSYEMVEVERKVLRQKGVWYHEVLIRCSFPKKFHENDSIQITYQVRKKKLYTILRSCWKEDA